MIKSINTSSVKSRRKFDETFKRDAVQNWRRSGKSAEVVAQELGLTTDASSDDVFAASKRPR
jgi:transposase-like protein